MKRGLPIFVDSEQGRLRHNRFLAMAAVRGLAVLLGGRGWEEVRRPSARALEHHHAEHRRLERNGRRTLGAVAWAAGPPAAPQHDRHGSRRSGQRYLRPSHSTTELMTI